MARLTLLPARQLIVLGLLVFATGCDRKSPTAPPSFPMATDLVISGADVVLTGVSTTYTATATFSDGRTQSGTTGWTSSSPSVATVDGAGRLEGHTHGSTSLTAIYAGRTVSKTVRVVNNYGGTWEGRYVVRACRDTGALRGVCLGPGGVGSVLGMRMTLVHSANDLSEIMATFADFGGRMAGEVAADGRLTLSGSLTELDYDYPPGIVAILRVGPWDTNLDGTDHMTGRWSQVYEFVVGDKGTAQTENELVTLTRVSMGVLPTSAMR